MVLCTKLRNHMQDALDRIAPEGHHYRLVQKVPGCFNVCH